MKPYFVRISLGLLFAAALGAPVVSQAQQWAQGDPSAQEQYTVELLNRFFADPTAFQARYINQYATDTVIAGLLREFSQGSAGSLYNASTYTPAMGAAYWLSHRATGFTPAAPLALYPAFSQMAASTRELAAQGDSANDFYLSGQYFLQWSPASADNGAYNPPTDIATPITVPMQGGPSNANYPSFSGPNATGGTATVAAGNWTGTNGVSSGNFNTYTAMAGFLYNVAVVGPREWVLGYDSSYLVAAPAHPVLTSPNFGSSVAANRHLRMMGVSVGQRVASPGSGDNLITVFYDDSEAFATGDLPYGAANTVFVTGVAYVDGNTNGEYDPGEGVSALNISIDGSSWFAVTATAGGYSIPVQVGAGSHTITATGTIGGKAVNQSQNVTIGTDNVKVDFVFASTRPAQVAVAGADGTNQLVNLSSRGYTSSGNAAIAGGFVISGTANKTVLLRGVAYSLYQFGVPTPLEKPQMTVFDSTGTVIANRSTQQTFADSAVVSAALSTGAFPLSTASSAAPGTARGDTAIVLTLSPGLYSFTITPAPDSPQNKGAGDGYGLGSGLPNSNQGTVLVEVYDVSVTDGSKLINISTRAQVDTADSLSAGFVVSGSGHKRLLVRGVGPTLGNFSVQSPLPDPFLTVYSGQTPIATNQGWDYGAQGTQITALEASTGAFALPDPSADTAALILVSPGPYTVPITSRAGNTGIALVEVYDAP